MIQIQFLNILVGPVDSLFKKRQRINTIVREGQRDEGKALVEVDAFYAAGACVQVLDLGVVWNH
jgi:hypothetical protein